MKKRSLRGKRGLAESPEQVQEKIQRRAYELYELRGREDGHDLDDWLKADSEVIGNVDRQ